uniref:Keratinocyte-associated transmembrane protein 2 n=1 Tax=Panagrellus redivivus TaxID=6233 RepID=A0A7E4V9M4_PANRE
MPPPLSISTLATLQPTGHTHAPHNLTLPTGKKSPISHLNDLEADEYAWLRFLFLCFVFGIIFTIWMYCKWRSNKNEANNPSISAHYHPLSTEMGELESDSDDSFENEIDLNYK